MNLTDLIPGAIRRERETAGVSLSALAAKTNLAKSTLPQLEAGEGNPSISVKPQIRASIKLCLPSHGKLAADGFSWSHGMAVKCGR